MKYLVNNFRKNIVLFILDIRNHKKKIFKQQNSNNIRCK